MRDDGPHEIASRIAKAHVPVRHPVIRWSFAHPSRITLAYIVLGVAWIISSDRLTAGFFDDDTITDISIWKGIGFIFVTGTALFFLLRFHYRIQRDYERALETSLQQATELADFLRVNPSPVIEFGEGGHVLMANPAAQLAADRYGHSDFHAILPPGILDLVRNCSESGKSVEERVSGAGGRTWHWWLFPVPGSKRCFGYAFDETEPEALRRRLAEAERLETLGHLARGIAHDFGNTLTAVSGAASLMEEDSLDQDSRENLETIRVATSQAMDLVAQLRSFGRDHSRDELIDLTAELRGLEPLLRHLVRTDVQITMKLPADALKVTIDRVQFGRCLVNLVVNANDAINGRGAVEIVLEPAPGEPGLAILTVRDSGTGMDEPTRQRIFEPLFTTKAERGTGLGLATVWSVVHQFGGEIDVDSEPGEGTTFSIRLPRAS